MCWNLQVSIIFAILETIGIGFLVVRARRSRDPYTRGQLWLVPLLCTILLAEVCEALIWLDSDNLVSITAKPGGPSCSPYNQFITWLIWLGVFPLQPYLVILPCRRALGGQHGNWEFLKVPEYLALTFALYFYFFTLMHSWGVVVNNSDFLPSRENIQRHEYELYTNTETCTYIGRFHHLFWTLNTTQSWMVPNNACYAILGSSAFYAKGKPIWRLIVWCVLFNSFLVLFLAELLDGSAETMSVWCWAGMSFHLYAICQPYLLPCHAKDAEEDDTATATSAPSHSSPREDEVVALTQAPCCEKDEYRAENELWSQGHVKATRERAAKQRHQQSLLMYP